MHQNEQKTEHMRNKLITQESLHPLMKQFLFFSLLCPNGVKSQQAQESALFPFIKETRTQGKLLQRITLYQNRDLLPHYTHTTVQASLT